MSTARTGFFETFAVATQHLSSMMGPSEKKPTETTPLVDPQISKAIREFEQAKKNYQQNIVSMKQLQLYGAALHHIEAVMKSSHNKPADLDLDTEKKEYYAASSHVAFLMGHGDEWKSYINRVNQVAQKKPLVEKELKNQITLAQEYCEICKNNPAFDPNKKYLSHLQELIPFEKLLEHSKIADEQKAITTSSFVHLLNPMQLTANVKEYFWPAQVDPAHQEETKEHIKTKRKPHLVVLEKGPESPGKDASHAPRSLSAIFGPTAMPPESQSMSMVSGEQSEPNKNCCHCACLSSLSFLRRKEEKSQEMETLSQHTVTRNKGLN